MLINVGDKFNLNNKNWEVILIDNDAVVVARSENGEEGIVSQRTIYKNWYEQQKRRADECCKVIDNLGRCAKLQEEKIDRLEKRWSELRERMEHDEKEAFGEGDVIAHTVHNYVLELMEGLEEDGE